jgi:hypothetical protein
MERMHSDLFGLRFVAFTLYCLCLSCAQPTEYESLRLRFPELPLELTAVLGDPLWVVSVRDADGMVIPGYDSGTPVTFFRPGCTASVLAYPVWPEHSIGPGIFRPAGAIYPFGVRDGDLPLDWLGGVAAHFHAELARVDGLYQRSPDFFDWPGFLELLGSASVREAVQGDPWLVDWHSVAQKTRASGFDRRRLVPRPAVMHRFLLPYDGPWFPSSPFGTALQTGTGSGIELPSSDEVDTLVGLQGVFRHRNGIGAWFTSPSCAVPRLQL